MIFQRLKQHFAFLKEQSDDFAVHYASIHLSAIRYMLVAHRMLASGESFGTVRTKAAKQLELPTFARLLWELFKALKYGFLDTLKNEISKETMDSIKGQTVTTQVFSLKASNIFAANESIHIAGYLIQPTADFIPYQFKNCFRQLERGIMVPFSRNLLSTSQRRCSW